MFDKFSERHIGVSNEKDLKAMLDIRRGKFCASVSFILPLCVRATAQLYEPCGAYAISLPEGGPGWDQNCKRRHRRRERLAGMKNKCEKYIQTT